jgi:hypothetical protein
LTAADARATKLRDERSRLAAQRAFLPPEPLREAAEAPLWEIGRESGDIYSSSRPAMLAAS